MLMGKGLVPGKVVLPPAEMGGGGESDPCPGTSRYGVDVYFPRELPGLCQGQKAQFNGGGKTARIGHGPGLCNGIGIEFGKAVHKLSVPEIGVRLQPEIIAQVDDPGIRGKGMLLQKAFGVSMAQTEEYQVHPWVHLP